MRQYAEPGFVSRATRVAEPTYEVVLDNIVVCCVDCVVVCGKQMLLGLRSQWPFKGWWVMGGRMVPGETYEATAQRVVEREVGLRIEDLRRFVFIDHACYIWRHREQDPQGNGCHMEGNNFYVEITEDEVARMPRRLGDFVQLEWVRFEDIIGNSVYHPSIQFFAETMLTQYLQ